MTPGAMAGERTLPTADAVAGLFPEGGLVRGRFLACTGPVATSLALALVAPAVAAGSWLAILDVPTLGLDAAAEAGLALERVVSVTSDDWPVALAAAADGFDLVLAGRPAASAASAFRRSVDRLRARVQRRGAVVVVLGDPSGLGCDVVLDSSAQVWSGLGDGCGRLGERSVEVRASGRRVPGGRSRQVVVSAGGHLGVAGPAAGSIAVAGPAAGPTSTDPASPVARDHLVLAG